MKGQDLPKLFISQSAIRDWLSCNKRYYYRLKFKDKSVPSRAMVLGNYVHKILEDYSTNNIEAMEEITRYKDKYNLPDSEVSMLVSSVKGFFDNFTQLVTEDDSKEVQFTMPYSDEVSLTGKFDRITPNHMVIDWKTGKQRKNLSNDVQSIIYSNAYTYLYGEVPTVIVAYLNSGSFTLYQADDLYVGTLFGEVIPAMIDSVYRDEYPHTGFFNGSCYRCPFKQFCFEEMGR